VTFVAAKTILPGNVTRKCAICQSVAHLLKKHSAYATMLPGNNIGKKEFINSFFEKDQNMCNVINMKAYSDDLDMDEKDAEKLCKKILPANYKWKSAETIRDALLEKKNYAEVFCLFGFFVCMQLIAKIQMYQLIEHDFKKIQMLDNDFDCQVESHSKKFCIDYSKTTNSKTKTAFSHLM